MKLTSLIPLLPFAFSILGCGGSSSSNLSSSKEKEKIEISFFCPESQRYIFSLIEGSNNLSKDGVEVHLKQAENKNVADLVVGYSPNEMPISKLPSPLIDYAKANTKAKMVDSFIKDGEIYGIPFGMVSDSIIYDRTVFSNVNTLGSIGETLSQNEAVLEISPYLLKGYLLSEDSFGEQAFYLDKEDDKYHSSFVQESSQSLLRQIHNVYVSLPLYQGSPLFNGKKESLGVYTSDFLTGIKASLNDEELKLSTLPDMVLDGKTIHPLTDARTYYLSKGENATIDDAILETVFQEILKDYVQDEIAKNGNDDLLAVKEDSYKKETACVEEKDMASLFSKSVEFNRVPAGDDTDSLFFVHASLMLMKEEKEELSYASYINELLSHINNGEVEKIAVY